MPSPPAKNDDAALVKRCIGGDGAAWSALVQRYQRLVYAIVLRTGMDEHMAADVFQTVFERLLKHLPKLEDPTRLQAWIVTTTKREALLQRRRGRRTVSMTQDESPDDQGPDWDIEDDAAGTEEAIEELQQLNLVRDAIDHLDDRCRDLLLLLFRDETGKLSYEDIASQLGVTTGSIGPTRSRCLDKLRRLVIERTGN